jgi:hypothetical protein
MKIFRLWIVAALAAAVIVGLLVLLTGCIIAPPPGYGPEAPYHHYPDWRLY